LLCYTNPANGSRTSVQTEAQESPIPQAKLTGNTSSTTHNGTPNWTQRTLLSGALAMASILLLPPIATRAAAQETTSNYPVIYTSPAGLMEGTRWQG